jgi:hypothetical protein
MNLIGALFKEYGLPLLIAFGLVFGIYHKGVTDERADWELKENKKLVAANQEILDLKNQKYDLEQTHRQDMRKAKDAFTKEINDVQTQASMAMDLYRTGAIKLSIPTVRTSSCESGTAGAGVSLSGSDGATRSELSGSAVEFLIGEATRADEVVAQLNICQAELLATHKACSQYLNQGEVK